MELLKKIITICSFQIGVNIIGLPEYHKHQKITQTVITRNKNKFTQWT